MNFIDSKKSIIRSSMPTSPLEMFDINEYLSVSELENISQEFRVSKKVNSVFNYLSNLSGEDRNKKIAEYNDLIDKAKDRQSKKIYLYLGISASSDIISMLLTD